MIVNLIYLILLIFYLIVLVFVVYSIYSINSAAPFVPTDRKRVRRMIELANIRQGERMMDLGSGDGRMVFCAAKKGAKCTGIEINPLLYYWSLFKKKLFKSKDVEFKRVNLWNENLSDVDVLTLFFINTKMEKLGKKIKKEMKSGSRVISYAFTFPSWQPEKKCGKLYLYRV